MFRILFLNYPVNPIHRPVYFSSRGRLRVDFLSHSCPVCIKFPSLLSLLLALYDLKYNGLLFTLLYLVTLMFFHSILSILLYNYICVAQDFSSVRRLFRSLFHVGELILLKLFITLFFLSKTFRVS